VPSPSLGHVPLATLERQTLVCQMDSLLRPPEFDPVVRRSPAAVWLRPLVLPRSTLRQTPSPLALRGAFMTGFEAGEIVIATGVWNLQRGLWVRALPQVAAVSRWLR
jgi:hypothetical protein